MPETQSGICFGVP